MGRIFRVGNERLFIFFFLGIQFSVYTFFRWLQLYVYPSPGRGFDTSIWSDFGGIDSEQIANFTIQRNNQELFKYFMIVMFLFYIIFCINNMIKSKFTLKKFFLFVGTFFILVFIFLIQLLFLVPFTAWN